MPSTADVHQFVVNALNKQRPDLAAPWRSRLADDAKEPASLTLLGRLAAAEGDIVGALTYTGEAIRIDPFYVEAYMHRAGLLSHAGAFDEAIRHYNSVLLFNPLHDEAVRALFVAAQNAHRPFDALEALNRRLRVGAETAELQNLTGLMRHSTGDLHGALAAYERASFIDPQSALYFNNQATILYHLERYDDALRALDQALQIMPDYAVAWQNVGNVYKAKRRLNLAERAFRRSIALAPEYPEPHFNLGCTLLQQNNWGEGWAEYEWRWNVPGLVTPIHADVPMWQGEPLVGRRIMVVAEQGSGDTLQFIRYIPKLVEMGAEIVIWAPVETASLLRRLPFVIAASVNRGELPQPDCYVPLMSIPRLLNASPNEIPAPPYLVHDQRRTQAFLREFGPRQENLRLGIAWAGNPQQVEDRHRSANLAELAPLFDVPSIRWISLQKGARTADIGRTGFPIEDWSDALHSFDETAALTAALDGVISICSAPIHVAGALNIRSVCMLTWSADWRWCEDENVTNWYPSVTLMRQNTLNDWRELAARTADHISQWKPKGFPRVLAG